MPSTLSAVRVRSLGITMKLSESYALCLIEVRSAEGADQGRVSASFVVHFDGCALCSSASCAVALSFSIRVAAVIIIIAAICVIGITLSVSVITFSSGRLCVVQQLALSLFEVCATKHTFRGCEAAGCYAISCDGTAAHQLICV